MRFWRLLGAKAPPERDVSDTGHSEPGGPPKSCRGVLDSNVLLDVATNDSAWGDWSARGLAQAAEYATLIINPIISAEVSIGYTTIEALEAVLP